MKVWVTMFITSNEWSLQKGTYVLLSSTMFQNRSIEMYSENRQRETTEQWKVIALQQGIKTVEIRLETMSEFSFDLCDNSA